MNFCNKTAIKTSVQGTNMRYMFRRATLFSTDLSRWGVHQRTYMRYMCRGATSFSTDLSRWGVRRVAYMDQLYEGSRAVHTWGITPLKDIPKNHYNTTIRDEINANKTIREAIKDWLSDSIQARLKWGPIEHWDTSQVTDMSCMFYGAFSFSADLSQWDTSQATDMSGMFYWASSFSADLSQCNTSQVMDMHRMFYGATSFSADVSRWDVSRVTNMYGMFRGATSFSTDLTRWDVRRCVHMDRMFDGSGVCYEWRITTRKDVIRRKLDIDPEK